MILRMVLLPGVWSHPCRPRSGGKGIGENGAMTRADWVNTTHDWAESVDRDHLAQIRGDVERYAPGGLLHLVLEVVAYPDDEAESAGRRGVCTVTLHADGSITVADDGRGTDTRVDEHGRPIKKPVMATQDLRFFEDPAAPLL